MDYEINETVLMKIVSFIYDVNGELQNKRNEIPNSCPRARLLIGQLLLPIHTMIC
jgi:hypothetical protein